VAGHKSDLATAPAQVLTILLRNYISAAVIERLGAGDFATRIRVLRGNH
jgi:hypothetical protein